MRLANILQGPIRATSCSRCAARNCWPPHLDILHLSDRPRVKLFIRHDPFDRFVSVLLFAPRERYDTRLRQRAGDILAAAYGGRISAYYPSFTDAPLAQVHFIIGVTPGRHLDPDVAAVEDRIAKAARTWVDDLEEAVRADRAETPSLEATLAAWREAFPIGYRDRYDAAEGLTDLTAVEGLGGGGEEIAVRAFRASGDGPRNFRFKLYRRGVSPAPLASSVCADPRQHGSERPGRGGL